MVCGELRRHAALGMCSLCWQKNPDRAAVRGQHLIAELDDPPGWVPPPAAAPALTIRVAPGVVMSTGKAVAQVGHAAQLALERLDAATVRRWLGAGAGVRVLTGAPVLPAAHRVDVRDGGYTEVAPGTTTASAAFEGWAAGPAEQVRPARR